MTCKECGRPVNKKVRKVVRLIDGAMNRMKIELQRGRGKLNPHNKKYLEQALHYSTLVIYNYRKVG
jgi:hypothetical protein